MVSGRIAGGTDITDDFALFHFLPYGHADRGTVGIQGVKSIVMVYLDIVSIPAAPSVDGIGGRGWIRTTEAMMQQIYSLPPLATRELAHLNKQLTFQDSLSLHDSFFILSYF